MYNQQVLQWLLKINEDDCLELDQSSVVITAGSDYQQVVFGEIDKKYYFCVIGSPYLMAMTKWLQEQLNTSPAMSLEHYDVTQLVDLFELPQHKRKDALLIVQLIEQLQG